MDTDKVSSLEKLYIKTHEACSSNNIKEIQDMLSPDCYPVLTQKEKEINIFNIANDLLESKELGHNILKYLIFDYGITEYPHFKQFHCNEVKAMFAARDLNNELDNSNKPSKKPKV